MATHEGTQNAVVVKEGVVNGTGESAIGRCATGIDLTLAGRSQEGMRIRITGTGSETIPQDHVQDRDQGVDPDEKSMFQDVEIIAAIGIIAEGGGITTVTVVAMSEIIDDTTKVVKPGNLATTKQILFQWKILLRSSLHRYHRLHHNNSINDIKS